MSVFRKKPVAIEAVRFTGWDYGTDIATWCGGTYHKAQGQGEHTVIYIGTLEGVMTANVGDWIIKGVEGEFYPVKDSIFRATYEEVAGEHADKRALDLDLAYWAWTVIANVSQGRWDEQTEEWQHAATRWRDAFHAALSKNE